MTKNNARETRKTTEARKAQFSTSIALALIAALLLAGFAFYAYPRLTPNDAETTLAKNSEAEQTKEPNETLVSVLDATSEYAFNENTVTVIEKIKFAPPNKNAGETRGRYEDELSFANAGDSEFDATLVEVVPPTIKNYYRYSKTSGENQQNERDAAPRTASQRAAKELFFQTENDESGENVLSTEIAPNVYLTRITIQSGGILKTFAEAQVYAESLSARPVRLLTKPELTEKEKRRFAELSVRINEVQLDANQALEFEKRLNRVYTDYSRRGKPIEDWFDYADFVVTVLLQGEAGAKALPEKIDLTVSELEPEASVELVWPNPIQSKILQKPLTGEAADYLSVETRTEGSETIVKITAFVDADYERKKIPFNEKKGEFNFMILGSEPVSIPITIKVEHEKTVSSLKLAKGVAGAACKQNAVAQPKKIASKTGLKADATKNELLEQCLREGNAVVNYAKSFCGTEYDDDCDDFWSIDLKEGRTPKKFNCACFVSFALEKSGLNGVYTQSAPSLLTIAKRTGGILVRANELLPGDLVFTKTYPGASYGEFTHVEFYAGDGELLGAGNPVQTRGFWERFNAYYECDESKYGKTNCATDNSAWWGKRVYRTALRVIPSCVEYTKLERAENTS